MAQLQISSSSRSNRNSKPKVNGIGGGKSNTSSSSISPSKRGCCLGCQFVLGVSSRKKPSSGKFSWRKETVESTIGGTIGRYRRYEEKKQLTAREKARKRSTYEDEKRATVVTRQFTQRKQGLYRCSPRPFKTGISGSSTNTKEISSDAAVSYFPRHHSSRCAASCPRVGKHFPCDMPHTAGTLV